MLEAGHVLISLDYRLAPETQLAEIVHDVEDAFDWIRRNGPRLFKIDPTRIAVAGGSAGGYLTLTSGFRVRPRPAVLLSLLVPKMPARAEPPPVAVAVLPSLPMP